MVYVPAKILRFHEIIWKNAEKPDDLVIQEIKKAKNQRGWDAKK